TSRCAEAPPLLLWRRGMGRGIAAQPGSGTRPLLHWRRGIGRGGRDRCHPTPHSQGRRRVLVAWNIGFGVCVGLLSPALSSKGGEGDIRFRRRVTQTQRPCIPALSPREREDCLAASVPDSVNVNIEWKIRS